MSRQWEILTTCTVCCPRPPADAVTNAFASRQMIRHRDTKCFNDVAFRSPGVPEWCGSRLRSVKIISTEFLWFSRTVVAVVRHCLLVNLLTRGGSDIDGWHADLRYRRRICHQVLSHTLTTYDTIPIAKPCMMLTEIKFINQSEQCKIEHYLP